MKSNSVPMVLVLIGLTALGLAACGDSSEEGGGASGGGGSGGSGATTSTTSDASSTTSSASTSGTGGGPTCHGDEAAWTTLTASAPACTTNADCCVIMNGCLSQGQVVGLADFETAGALWPYCDDQCNDCIPPAVEVGCTNGVCVGQELIDAAGDSPLRMDHCGTNDVAVPDPTLTFGCGG